MGASQSPKTDPLTSVEICAGAGGQAVGLHRAGFKHLALVELDPHAVATLRKNVHRWHGWNEKRANEIEPMDVRNFLDSDVLKSLSLKPEQLDLLAGGVPCPPFSLAGKRLGEDDDRDLFPDMLRIVDRLRPKAVMIENVRGILEPPQVFIDYRRRIVEKLGRLGYVVPTIDGSWSPQVQDLELRSVWRRLDACDFGVPQLRPRAILVAIHEKYLDGRQFIWPKRTIGDPSSVFDVLENSMLERCLEFWNKNEDGEDPKPGQRTGRDVFEDWRDSAQKAKVEPGQGVAPTLVGGSKKHGGADLGPTRAKRAWADLGVDATGVANDPKECYAPRDLFRKNGPMLTVDQAAMLQGFPPEWRFQGGKTAQYRQVGNAFPPPVAEAVGRAIAAILRPDRQEKFAKLYELDEEGSFPASRSDMQLAVF